MTFFKKKKLLLYLYMNSIFTEYYILFLLIFNNFMIGWIIFSKHFEKYSFMIFFLNNLKYGKEEIYSLRFLI